MGVNSVERKQFIIDGKLLFGRRCAKCLINKPFSQFGTSKRATFGVSSRCLKCSGQKTKRGINIPLEVVLINGQEVKLKTCTKCRKKKSLDEFNHKKDGSGGVHSECKGCLLRRIKKNKKRMTRERKREYQTTARLKEKVNGRRTSYEKDLPVVLKVEELRMIYERFPACALTELPNPELEHFIPLSVGHGGNHIGNLYRLNRDLNMSKGVKNPFEWKKEIQNESWFREAKWNELIQYLADQNGVTVSEFELFIYWCFNNPRSKEDMKENIQKRITYNSLAAWKSTKKELESI